MLCLGGKERGRGEGGGGGGGGGGGCGGRVKSVLLILTFKMGLSYCVCFVCLLISYRHLLSEEILNLICRFFCHAVGVYCGGACVTTVYTQVIVFNLRFM